MIAVFWIALLVLGGICVAALVLYRSLQSSLPQTSGTIAVTGITSEIEVIRDNDAVPHIYAQNKRDALFGLGYIHAQDRLWQMDSTLRLARGSLSELFGKRTLRLDRYMRTLGIYRTASESWQRLPASTQEAVLSYVAGINACIAQRKYRLLPEFFLLRAKPQHWSGPDVLALMKVVSLELSGNAEIEVLYHEVVAEIGREKARKLFPPYPADGPLIVSEEATAHWRRAETSATSASMASQSTTPTTAWQRETFAQLGEMQTEIREMLGKDVSFPSDLGSNSWVVDGTKSSTAKPLLACDPHLGITAPSLWYLAHLEAGDFAVAGATIPGLPAVVIGRNKEIAWGMSNMNADVQDLYYEKVDAGRQKAAFKNQWEEIETHQELIKVRGRREVTHLVRRTRHGPILTDAFEAGRFSEEQPLALSWSALSQDDTTIMASLQLNEARNWDEFKQALSHHKTPPLNFIYADIAGNIGYHAAGLIPLKAAHQDPLPLEGWSGEHEWQGWIPFNELPHTFNPPEHFIVSANQKPAPDSYPYFLGSEWSSVYRAQAIKSLLEREGTFTLADFARMQANTVSGFACSLLPSLLELVTSHNQIERQALELLQGWDKDMRGDSAAAAICGVWMSLLRHEIVAALLPPPLARRYEWRFQYSSRVLSEVFLDPAQTLLSPGERAGISQRTFRLAVHKVAARLGSNVNTWRWDRLHRLQVHHSTFGQIPLVRHFFSRSTPSAGDWGTINVGPIDEDLCQYAGAGYRQLIELGSLENDQFLHVLGQSGHPLSPHYADYLDDWQQGRYRPLRFTHEAVENGRIASLRLIVRETQAHGRT